MDYEIKCNSKFSWSYIHPEHREIWADSIEGLKRKVLDRNLPWDDDMVPDEKSIPDVPFFPRMKFDGRR